MSPPARAFELEGRVVDLEGRRVFPGVVTVEDGRIARVDERDVESTRVLSPGFVDAHVHVESSMLVPSEFARLAVVHGTVGTVSDPHEIANVLGVEGVDFMIADGARVPFKFAFGAPSCVPATRFETAGAELGPFEIDRLLGRPEVRYLSEMMNWPGVLSGDPEVEAILEVARRHGKPIDGHAPGLRGDDARRYAAAGISTDHESVELDEARDKLAAGMTILVREGSAAKNFDALIPLLGEAPDRVMFCTDDLHPDDLVRGHMDRLLARAVAAGHDPLDALRACVLNPVRHYGLEVGLLEEGDPADLVELDDLRDFRVRRTWIGGVEVARDGRSLIEPVETPEPNAFDAVRVSAGDLLVRARGTRLRVIEARPGALVTGSVEVDVEPVEGEVRADPGRDLLKLVVVSRYGPAPPAVAFVRGFGLRRGALASSVAHDSHNLIAVGASDEALAAALEDVSRHGGGIALADGEGSDMLPLPVAGLMSTADGATVARAYQTLDRRAREELGSPLPAPFMTLSFMALLVIPSLKLSDRGLFDGRRFTFVDPFVA